MLSVTSCWSRLSRRCVVATAAALNLSPRLFNALLLFVEHAGELLDKDALMRTLVAGPGGRREQPEPGGLQPAPCARRRPRGQPLHPDRAAPRLQVRRHRDGAAGADGDGSTLHATPEESPQTRFRCLRPMSPPFSRPRPTQPARTGEAHASTRRHWLHLVLIGGAAASLGAVGFGQRAVRSAPAAQARPRRWPCCRSSRWRRKRATSCWKWAWPTA